MIPNHQNPEVKGSPHPLGKGACLEMSEKREMGDVLFCAQKWPRLLILQSKRNSRKASLSCCQVQLQCGLCECSHTKASAQR